MDRLPYIKNIRENKLPRETSKFLSKLQQAAKSESDDDLLKEIADKNLSQSNPNKYIIYVKEAKRRGLDINESLDDTLDNVKVGSVIKLMWSGIEATAEISFLKDNTYTLRRLDESGDRKMGINHVLILPRNLLKNVFIKQIK